LVDTAVQTYGRVDVLINNAGLVATVAPRSDLEAARKHGIRLLSAEGDLHYQGSNLYGSPAEIGEDDLVIISINDRPAPVIRVAVDKSAGGRVRWKPSHNDHLLAAGHFCLHWSGASHFLHCLN
jgi:NAD(P)-dependent dehydrogenase (short-subunit alcohol dehydrogenase family)